jgi:hypothetical protein
MRTSDARFGGWLEVLDRTCICDASTEDLVPATQNEAQRVVGRAELAVVLVPDDWPGETETWMSCSSAAAAKARP